MKYIFFSIIGALITVSCSNNRSKNFVVTGNLKNAPVTVVYLEQIAYDNMPPQVIDSTTMRNGVFTLKGTSSEESLLQLRFPAFENSPVFFIVNDEPAVQLNGNWANTRQSIFKNSPASERLRVFVDSLSATQQQLFAMQQQLDILRTQGDSVVQVQQSKLNQLLQSFRGYVKQTADNDPSPIVSMFATSLNTGTSMEENEAMFNNLIKRFPKHIGIQTVVNQYREGVAAANKQQQKKATGPAIGSIAPEITLPDVNGKSFSLSSLRGNYVLVDFWASWCGPCRMENPKLVEVYNKFKSKNFTILGVSLDKTKEDWIEAINKDGLTWIHISDLKFWESAAVTLYGFNSIPYNVLIDREGKIVAINLRADELERKLGELLK